MIEDLQKNGPEYNVFFAIYLAEIATAAFYDKRDAAKFDQTGLKFRPFENYVYPPTDIRAITYENDAFHFVINFMGLYGVNAALPRCYHEQVAQQQTMREKGTVPLQNFYDIFNNRFYWLYYQSWKKYRYYLQFNEALDNPTMERIFSFIGQGPQHKRDVTKVDPIKLLQCSGVLSNRVRNKAGLLILLKEFFPSCSCKIREFVPHMVKLADRPIMGIKSDRESFRLGFCILGASIQDCMGRIRVEIGPIDFDTYLKFMPGAPCAKILNRLLNLYLSDGLEYDIRLIIKTDGIKPLVMGQSTSQLGLNMWLRKPKKDHVQVDYPYERYSREVEE